MNSRAIIATAIAVFVLVSAVTVLGQPSDLREIVPSGHVQPPVAPGPDAWGAGAKLAAAAMTWLADQALKTSIHRAVADLQPNIDKAMPALGGVLIVVGIQQSLQPDVNGQYAPTVLEAHVGGAGARPKETLEKYI
jgi:hypothetical protein